LLAVVGDVEHLPFRGGSFAGLVCDDTIEHLPHDTLGVEELGRVLQPLGVAILATPNRHNAMILITRWRHWWRGWHRSTSSYFVANSHLREYTWSEFEALVQPVFQMRRRLPIGWEQSRKRRLASRILVGPLRGLSQIIVIEAMPR
jgi:ubiquinone/menaquinone biosynthesis C-methylase UbiE